MQIEEALEDFPDISLISNPPTRDNQQLDKIFVTFKSQIFESGVFGERGLFFRLDRSVVKRKSTDNP